MLKKSECRKDDKYCLKLENTLKEIREFAEEGKKHHAFKKYTYPKLNKLLEEADI